MIVARRIALGTLVLLLAVGTASEAGARARGVPGGSISLGPVGGWQITSPDVDLLGERERDVRLDDAPWAGLRLGLGLARPLALDVTAAWMPAGTRTSDEEAHVFHALGELSAHFLAGPIVIDIVGGAGVSALMAGDLGSDADLLLSAGLGLRWITAGGRMAVRLDGRALFSDSVDGALAAHSLGTLGLDVFLWRPEWRKVPPPPPAPPADIDGDGVADDEDRCPDDAGPPDAAGCPDGDGDGLVDPDDACPETAGEPEHSGCPDSDGDGLPDTVDACPTLSGFERYGGCPDSDDDGVPDGEDACPRLKGDARERGCPAPDPALLAALEGPMPDVLFEEGTAELQPGANPALSRLAALLSRFPQIAIEVQAHTHARLEAQEAHALTEARARVVLQELIALGADPRRLTSVGLGADRPLASNRTRAGRARNERIEVRVVEVP